jgi:translation initiation factor IF-2
VTAPKVRVHEISKILGVSNAEVIEALAKQFNVQAKSHSSTVEQDIADKFIASFKGANAAAKPSKGASASQSTPPPKATQPEEKMPVATPQPVKPAAETAKPKTQLSATRSR